MSANFYKHVLMLGSLEHCIDCYNIGLQKMLRFATESYIQYQRLPGQLRKVVWSVFITLDAANDSLLCRCSLGRSSSPRQRGGKRELIDE